MAADNYFKEMYFMVKWVYLETIPGGETIPYEGVSKMINTGGDQDNVWASDFVDCYLSEQDTLLFGPLLKDGFKMWIKCVHDPKPCEHNEMEFMYQPCFLCIKCPLEEDVKYLKEVFGKSHYSFITLDLFPWPQDAYDDGTW